MFSDLECEISSPLSLAVLRILGKRYWLFCIAIRDSAISFLVTINCGCKLYREG